MSTPSPNELTSVYRRYLAAVVLFHQRAATEAGIGATDYQASSLLALRDTMTAGDLGAALGLTSGATTRLIDRLVAAGLARRVEDPTDRRRVLVAHTGAMAERLQQELEAVRQPIGATIARLDPHQLDGLLAYFASAATAFESAAHTVGRSEQQ
jgi:DNA-binding MarR family transcriptional regulator